MGSIASAPPPEIPAAAEKWKAALHACWPWMAAILSGVLLVLSFEPFDQGWLVWIALTPLLCAVWFRKWRISASRQGWRSYLNAFLKAAAPGYAAGIVFFTGTFYWLGTLADLYANPLLRSLPFLLALVLAGYFAVWTWFLDQVLVPDSPARLFPSSIRNLGAGAAGAGAWVALEWVRGWLFGGFGWNGLGVAMHRELTMIQIAEFTGVWGVSWLIAFVNLMAVIIVRRIIGEIGPVFLKRVRWEFSISVALVFVVFGFGVRALLANQMGPTVPLRIVALQPNIPQREKFDPAAEDQVLATFERLTTLATISAQPPHLVIWPESSTPRPLFADEKIYRFVHEQASRGEYGLLFGTVDFDPARGEDYNVAALFTERGDRLQIYRKIHLVPFGEYLPLRPILGPVVADLIPGDFTAGTEHTLLELSDPAIRIGALVCFEDTVGDLTRRFAARGAQLLVNITNDGWFGRSPAAAQHLANATFRAIETRRPLVRCGNTGLTGSIDPFGRTERLETKSRFPRSDKVVPFLKPFQQGFVPGEIAVPLKGPATFYARHGDWLPVTCLALAVLLCLRRGVRPWPRKDAPAA